jgi:hypothetical protein
MTWYDTGRGEIAQGGQYADFSPTDSYPISSPALSLAVSVAVRPLLLPFQVLQASDAWVLISSHKNRSISIERVTAADSRELLVCRFPNMLTFQHEPIARLSSGQLTPFITALSVRNVHFSISLFTA